MMEGDAAMVRIQRQSSMESEPRTLTMDQIQFARGLEPVGGRNGDRMKDISREMQSVEELEQLQLTEIRDIASAPF
ncbi:hypothetical protein Peur_012663 [Populus x canadensis]